MSITHPLVLTHLGSTAVLLAVLWLVIVVQSLSSLITRLHRRWAVSRRHPVQAASTAAARFSGVDRRRPVHSSS